MLAHSLSVGDIIFDIRSESWGIVEYLRSPDNKEPEVKLTEDDGNVNIGFSLAYYDAEEDQWIEGVLAETYADCAFPLALGVSFKGKNICWEINPDEFDADHDYDFYCPDLQENCWEFELD